MEGLPFRLSSKKAGIKRDIVLVAMYICFKVRDIT